MNQKVLDKLKKMKLKYASEGFIILGVFGSYAQGKENSESDIDILYQLSDDFYTNYPGLKAFGKIYDIKEELMEEFHTDVDLADKDTLHKIGKKYILPGVKYV